jgi:hypothetical protein
MTRRLLEVVDGVPIYAKAKAADLDPLALAPGRRGRLTEGGPFYEVDRIGSGAAYVHKVYDPPMERRVGPWDKLDDLAKAALAATETGTPEQAFVAAYHLAVAGRQCTTIYATRGPAEPGIALASRFVERAADGPAPVPPAPKAPAPKAPAPKAPAPKAPAPKAPAPKAPAPKAPAPKAPKVDAYRACSQAAVAAGFAPGIEYNARGYWRALRAWCESTGKVPYPGAR